MIPISHTKQNTQLEDKYINLGANAKGLEKERTGKGKEKDLKRKCKRS